MAHKWRILLDVMAEPGDLRDQGRMRMDVNDVTVELLITDSNVALTFLDLAQSTQVEEDRTRRIGEAHTAYTTILRMLPRFLPTPEQKRQLDKNLNVLRTRLLAAGVHLPQEENGASRRPDQPPQHRD